MKDSSQSVYSKPGSQVGGEEYYGCGLHIFGDPGNPEYIGATGVPLQAEGTGLNWASRSYYWNNDDGCTPPVGDYHHNLSSGNTSATLWDDRNSS